MKIQEISFLPEKKNLIILNSGGAERKQKMQPCTGPVLLKYGSQVLKTTWNEIKSVWFIRKKFPMSI